MRLPSQVNIRCLESGSIWLLRAIPTPAPPDSLTASGIALPQPLKDPRRAHPAAHAHRHHAVAKLPLLHLLE